MVRRWFAELDQMLQNLRRGFVANDPEANVRRIRQEWVKTLLQGASTVYFGIEAEKRTLQRSYLTVLRTSVIG
jgi:hypothetical protein